MRQLKHTFDVVIGSHREFIEIQASSYEDAWMQIEEEFEVSDAAQVMGSYREDFVLFATPGRKVGIFWLFDESASDATKAYCLQSRKLAARYSC